MRVGAADYSPTDGQYYFSSGVDCPLDARGDVRVGCGVVADFRALQEDDLRLTDTLQACWWGALGE